MNVRIPIWPGWRLHVISSLRRSFVGWVFGFWMRTEVE